MLRAANFHSFSALHLINENTGFWQITEIFLFEQVCPRQGTSPLQNVSILGIQNTEIQKFHFQIVDQLYIVSSFYQQHRNCVLV